MKTPFKELLGILILGAFISVIGITLSHFQKPDPIEQLEQRLDEKQEQESVLTDNEKELKSKSLDKEWEEVDKQIDK